MTNSPVGGGERDEPPFLEQLALYQQADAEGIMVLASRQAIDEAIAYIRQARAASDSRALTDEQIDRALDAFEGKQRTALWNDDTRGIYRADMRRALTTLQPVPAQGWQEAIEAAASAALNAQLPKGYQWGNDAMEAFNFGKTCAHAAVIALTLTAPRTPTKEVK